MRYLIAILAGLVGVSVTLADTHLTRHQVYVNDRGIATIEIQAPARTLLPAGCDFLYWSLVRETGVGVARSVVVQGDILPNAGFTFAELSPNIPSTFRWEAYDRHYHLIKTITVAGSPFTYSVPQ